MVPLLVMAALQVDSALLESQTFDEAVHLTAGYRYWLTGRFSMNREHPPLQKLLSALPLLLRHCVQLMQAVDQPLLLGLRQAIEARLLT